MSLKKRIAVAIGSGALIAVAAVAQTAPTTGRSIETLAQLKLRSPDGAHFPLGRRIEAGKPTLIAFWASWCPPCIAEAPHLANLRRKFGGDYNFIYINRREGNPDLRQPPAAMAQFLARGGLTDADYVTVDVPTYRRIVGADIATMPAGIVGIPRIYLFDRHGRQVYSSLGFAEAKSAELEQQLKEAVAVR